MDMPDFLLKLQFRTTWSREILVNDEQDFQPVPPPGRGWIVCEDQGSSAKWCRARAQSLNALGVPLREEPSEYELAIFQSIGAYILGRKE